MSVFKIVIFGCYFDLLSFEKVGYGRTIIAVRFITVGFTDSFKASMLKIALT